MEYQYQLLPPTTNICWQSSCMTSVYTKVMELEKAVLGLGSRNVWLDIGVPAFTRAASPHSTRSLAGLKSCTGSHLVPSDHDMNSSLL